MKFLVVLIRLIQHPLQKVRRTLLKPGRLVALMVGLLIFPNVAQQVAAHDAFFDVRINAGGPAQTVNGVEWLACTSVSNCNNYVSGGFSYTKTPLTGVSPVVSPANAFIYQSEWTGGSTTGVPAGGVAFSFNVPIPNGDYTVRLHFAEFVQNSAGARLFDVKIEGSTVLTNFDVYQQAGGMHKGIVREFERTLTDGIMTIEFIRQTQNAKISGIEIIHIDDGTTPPPDEEPPVPPQAGGSGFQMRINAGGNSQNVNGVEWGSCTSVNNCVGVGYVSGGFGYTPSPASSISPVVSPANQTIYQSEWTGGSTTGVPDGGVAFAFNIPVPNGNHLVRLHFAELNQNGAGLRVFDVRIEGGTVLTNFDVYQQAGGMNKGIVREFQRSVSDGVMTIEFIRRTQNAKISAIEIIHLDGGSSNPTKQALFVVGNTVLNGADAKIKTRLETLGYIVEVIKDSSATLNSTSGKNIVVISSSVSSTNVGTKLTNATVPLMNWEPYLIDDLKLAVSGNRVEAQTQLTIANSGHALAGGLSGTVTTNTSATEFASGGQPSASAIIVAHALNQSSKPVIFGYNQGSSMVGLTAPAKRVGFFMGDNTPNSMTSQGWQLFDAAVNWLGGGQSNPTPTTNITWTQKNTNPTSRMEAIGTTANGRLYVFGGYTQWPNATTAAHYYDPVTNTWTQIADMPEAVTHAQVVSDGGKIYLVGGFLGAYPSPSTGRVWIYTISTNTWAQGPSLPLPLGAGGAAILNGQLYYFGGTIRQTNPSSFSDQKVAYVLNLNGGTTWQPIAPIPTPRNHLAAITFNGKIYVIGGQAGGNEGAGNLDTVEIYNPSNNTWTTTVSMPIKKGHIASSTFLHNGYIYVIGGTENDGVYGAASASVIRYDLTANNWTTLNAIPEARKQPVAGSIGGKLYVTTGQNTNPSNVTWEGVLNP